MFTLMIRSSTFSINKKKKRWRFESMISWFVRVDMSYRLSFIGIVLLIYFDYHLSSLIEHFRRNKINWYIAYILHITYGLQRTEKDAKLEIPTMRNILLHVNPIMHIHFRLSTNKIWLILNIQLDCHVKFYDERRW